MKKKYKLLILESILLSEVFYSFVKSDINFDILNKSFKYFDLNLEDIYTKEELIEYNRNVSNLAIFSSKLILLGGSYLYLDDEEKVKTLKKY